MIIHVLFGQRIEHYSGEYVPEALEVMSEYCYDENPDWLNDKYQEHLKENCWKSLKVIKIEINDEKLEDILVPRDIILKGKIQNE